MAVNKLFGFDCQNITSSRSTETEIKDPHDKKSSESPILGDFSFFNAISSFADMVKKSPYMRALSALEKGQYKQFLAYLKKCPEMNQKQLISKLTENITAPNEDLYFVLYDLLDNNLIQNGMFYQIIKKILSWDPNIENTFNENLMKKFFRDISRIIKLDAKEDILTKNQWLRYYLDINPFNSNDPISEVLCEGMKIENIVDLFLSLTFETIENHYHCFLEKAQYANEFIIKVARENLCLLLKIIGIHSDKIRNLLDENEFEKIIDLLIDEKCFQKAFDLNPSLTEKKLFSYIFFRKQIQKNNLIGLKQYLQILKSYHQKKKIIIKVVDNKIYLETILAESDHEIINSELIIRCLLYNKHIEIADRYDPEKLLEILRPEFFKDILGLEIEKDFEKNKRYISFHEKFKGIENSAFLYFGLCKYKYYKPVNLSYDPILKKLRLKYDINETLLPNFKKWVLSIINDTYDQLMMTSPHLENMQILMAHSPKSQDLVSRWVQYQKIISNQGFDIETLQEAFAVKILKGFFSEIDHPDFCKAAENINIIFNDLLKIKEKIINPFFNEFQKKISDFLKERKKLSRVEELVYRICVNKKRFMEKIESLVKELSKELSKDLKFYLKTYIINEFEMLKKNFVISIMRPEEALILGNETGGCLKVSIDYPNNAFLLGTFCGGENKVIIVKNKKGAIEARAIIRLLIFSINGKKKPVLFLEKYGAKKKSPHLIMLLRKYAIFMAKDLKIPLFNTVSNESIMNVDLYTLGNGLFPGQAVDSCKSEGKYNMGQYVIEKASDHLPFYPNLVKI